MDEVKLLISGVSCRIGGDWRRVVGKACSSVPATDWTKNNRTRNKLWELVFMLSLFCVLGTGIMAGTKAWFSISSLPLSCFCQHIGPANPLAQTAPSSQHMFPQQSWFAEQSPCVPPGAAQHLKMDASKQIPSQTSVTPGQHPAAIVPLCSWYSTQF